ncbi:RNA polymerase sigma factor [Pseudobacteriovorax antillogorgiicola]|uniref:RNA polymerase sigma factor, sigma-70 family n=1 Tax=Pseudobacteriovorax antillogorgiicola TaxID=1513793 RepID=A0A1Y6CAY4_9BACT|nr:RNA polymerase sigma factor [Pseudobacteriovorax antillogorgiicola]TCS49844.1 RNA polymerase sigma factor (sigma-70 family) [Pseudobacteriovorax antillogorgiicola]SMF43607.1 RNA polymerase sigma factor, sigma-70 family [Pseudobacteriovorax antillogorgiicola]
MKLDSSNQEDVRYLYEKTGPAVLSKIGRMISSSSIAEEILQDTFAKLWMSNLTFAFEGQAFNWIYRTSHNAAIDQIRKSRRHRDEPWEHVESVCQEKNEQILVEVLHDFEKILSQLKDRDAAIYVYQTIDQMTQHEIAEFMDISRATVARSLSSTQNLIAKRKEG